MNGAEAIDELPADEERLVRALRRGAGSVRDEDLSRIRLRGACAAAVPQLGPWALEGKTWAPEVLARGTDSPQNPILTSACRASGPGHQALVEVDGQTWMAYHAWPGDSREQRELWLDRVAWDDVGRPAVQGPTCGGQPAP